MRKNIAAGNWKMNTLPTEGKDLILALNTQEIPDDTTVIIGVPFTHLYLCNDVASHQVNIAAQNCYFEEKGAYTGEISIAMLKDINIQYVIIGHSERREIFGESDELLKSKVTALSQAKMKTIFCCGEPLEVRKAENQNNFVKAQLEASLFHLSAEEIKDVVIAYEPIWAIGTGETASPAQAEDMHAFIRSLLTEKYGDLAQEISILYGGSVKPANAKELFAQPNIDGGLVGGASLKTDSFAEIIKSF